MSFRDNFPARTVRNLALRAGGQCSNPGCNQPTSGPGEKDISDVALIGVAAHITAAAVGGPRFDPNLTPKERRSIGNGIHLCQNCAKLVDSNGGKDYPVEELRQWKKLHEAKIRERLSSPSKRQKAGESLLQPGVNALEAKKRWDRLLEIFSQEKTNVLADQITNIRRAPCQIDCPDIKQFVEKKFMPIGKDLHETYAKEVGKAYERAKKILHEFISSKNKSVFFSDWAKVGKDLEGLGYFQ